MGNTMTDDLLALKTETDAALSAATDLRAWDAIRVAVLGRNGTLTGLLRDLGNVQDVHLLTSSRLEPAQCSFRAEMACTGQRS